MKGAQITEIQAISPFVLSGRATVTVVSKSTGKRFTYRVERRRVVRKEGESDAEFQAREAESMNGVRFVKVLTGNDNENHYTYVGHLNNKRQFRLDKSSKMSEDAPSVQAWKWFWAAVQAESSKLSEQAEVWHDGRCGRCHRKLTVPESIATGLGPVCAEKA